MSLSRGMIDYLRKYRLGPARRAMMKELEESGYSLEALLLEAEEGHPGSSVIVDLPGSPWHQRRAYLGLGLPTRAETGDLWFDPCELATMILIPREQPDPEEGPISPECIERLTPFVGWMSLRPVAQWQFHAFLELARFAPRRVEVGPKFKLLDDSRLIQGPEYAPVVNVTCGEAEMYASWFGKGLADREIWQAANDYLTQDEMSVIWGPTGGEWGGSSFIAEGYVEVVTRQNLHLDPMEEWDSGESPEFGPRIIYGEWSKRPDVGFRTAVSTQIGLLNSTSPSPTSFDDVSVVSPLKRV